METENIVKERYQRQILVPTVGEKGQKELFGKRVLVVGAGGLGTPCISYLAGMGIGHITILDPDVVSLSNLPRQTMYDLNDIGKPKALVIARKLVEANPNVTFRPLVDALSESNALDLVKGHDVLVSCLDNLEARYILNEAAVTLETPLVEGAVVGFQGLCTVVIPQKGPCYHCIFPKRLKTQDGPLGVIGPAPGVIGAIQAVEVLKLLLKIGEPLCGRLLIMDLLTSEFRVVAVKKDPSCPVCKKPPGK